MHKDKKNWVYQLSKRLQNAWTITISAMVGAVFLYTLLYQLYPYTGFKQGLTLAIIISILIGYPLGKLVTNYNGLLRKQNNQIKRNNEIKSQLINILGHDIKSPLNNLSQMLDMIVEKQISEDELRQVSRQLIQDVDRTLTLTNNLINWIKIQSVDYAPKYREFSFEEIVKESVDLFIPIAENKNIELKVEYPKGKQLYSDPEMCKIILRNLISNAIKFSREGSKIEVKILFDNGACQFQIIDEGVGLNNVEIENILNASTIASQLGTANEKGTGIGLQLTKQIIDQLEGKMWLESSPGHGTTFYITIPHLHTT